VDAAGNVYIADVNNHQVRKVLPDGSTISTVAGTGVDGYNGDSNNTTPPKTATTAQLFSPHGVAINGAGTILYIADTFNHRVRKVVLSSQTITTVAGDGSPGSSGDGGPATSARLYNPKGVALNAAGTILYIADYQNHRVRKVDLSSGTITTVAGTGVATDTQVETPPGSGTFVPDPLGALGDDGPATAASLNGPTGVAVDGGGNLFIADTINERVRKVDTSATPTITTVAGNGTPDFSGDGGLATAATLNSPSGVAVAAGNLFIADSGNNRVRRVDASGTIITVAGTGAAGAAGDGGASTSAELNTPTGVAAVGADHFYIADVQNQKIREVGLEP